MSNINNEGSISFNDFKVDRITRSSFLEYVFGGCEIGLSIAIDFTGSNGNPTQKSSIHYYDPETNQYLQAIKSIGDILQFYNSSK